MRSRTALFPAGSAGVGLFLLRASVAVSTLVLTASCPAASQVPQFAGILVAISLCLGLQTRLLAGLGFLASLLCLFLPALAGLAAIHALTAAALTMTGPGAISLDAKLFGHRTVTLPDPDNTNV